jgi:hypothetical protein
MSNPVTTYHGVRIYLARSDYPGCEEIVIMAATRGGPVQIFPGIVVDDKDMAALSELFKNRVAPPIDISSLEVASYEVWKRKVVREACERNGVTVASLKDKRRFNQPSVRSARAQAVRVLVGFMSYLEAGKEVGIYDHSSVHYWVKGAGKGKYKS